MRLFFTLIIPHHNFRKSYEQTVTRGTFWRCDCFCFKLQNAYHQVRLAPSSSGQNMDPWRDESFFVPKPGCHSVSARLAAASPAGRTRDRFPRRDEP
jgi:hypothetical protein